MRRPAILVIGMFFLSGISFLSITPVFAAAGDLWRICDATSANPLNSGHSYTPPSYSTGVQPYYCCQSGTTYAWQTTSCFIPLPECDWNSLWTTNAASGKCCYDSSQSGYYLDDTGTCPGDSSSNPVAMACGLTSSNYMVPPGNLLYYQFDAAGKEVKLTLDIEDGTNADHDIGVADTTTWPCPAADNARCGTFNSGDSTDYCPSTGTKALSTGNHCFDVKRFSSSAEAWFNTKLECLTTSCHRNPAVAISPESKKDFAGTPVAYAVTVTNNDVASCPVSETYTLSAAGICADTSWTCAFSSSSLSIARGASASSTLTVTSPSSAAKTDFAFLATAAIASPSHTASTSGTYGVFDFAVTASSPVKIKKPSTGSIDTGFAASVSSENGFNRAVSLTRAWVDSNGNPVTAPAGITLTNYNPASVTPAAGTVSSSLTINVSSTAVPGTYKLKTTGTSGTKSHSVTSDIVIEPPTGCKFTKASITACPGGTCEAGETITMKAYYGSVAAACDSAGSYLQIDAKSADDACKIQYSGGNMPGITKQNPAKASDADGYYLTGTWVVPAITSACSGKTANAYSASLWDGTPAGSGSTQITSITDAVPAAAAPVAGSLVFSAAPDYTVTAPSPITIVKPATGPVNTPITITVDSVSGFSSAVSLDDSWVDSNGNPVAAPAGITVSYSPVSVTPPANGDISSTATVAVSSTTPLGTFTLRTTGTSGAKSHYADTTVIINPPPACAFSSASITNCPGGTCEKGEAVPMTATFTGPCPATGLADYYLQIDAKSEDGACTIDYGTGNINGLTQKNPGVSGTTYTGTWSVPNIPAACLGKTVYAWGAGLWNGPVGSAQVAGISDTAKGKPITDDTYVSGSLAFPTPPVIVTTVTSCGASSAVALTLAPNPAASGALVTPTVSVPTICSGKTAWVMSKSVKISSCVIAVTGTCKAPVFPAPSASVDYFAFIDLDNDGIMITAEPRSPAVALLVTPASATSVPSCAAGAACSAYGATCCSKGKLYKCI